MQRQGPQPGILGTPHVEQQTMFYVLTGDPPSNQLADEHSCHIHFVRGHGQQLQYKETQLQAWMSDARRCLLLCGEIALSWVKGQWSPRGPPPQDPQPAVPDLLFSLLFLSFPHMPHSGEDTGNNCNASNRNCYQMRHFADEANVHQKSAMHQLEGVGKPSSPS